MHVIYQSPFIHLKSYKYIYVEVICFNATFKICIIHYLCTHHIKFWNVSYNILVHYSWQSRRRVLVKGSIYTCKVEGKCNIQSIHFVFLLFFFNIAVSTEGSLGIIYYIYRCHPSHNKDYKLYFHYLNC